MSVSIEMAFIDGGGLKAAQRERLDQLAAIVVPPGIDPGGIGALRRALRALDQGASLDAASRVQLQHWLDAETLYGPGAAGDARDDDAIRVLLAILDARHGNTSAAPCSSAAT